MRRWTCCGRCRSEGSYRDRRCQVRCRRPNARTRVRPSRASDASTPGMTVPILIRPPTGERGSLSTSIQTVPAPATDHKPLLPGAQAFVHDGAFRSRHLRHLIKTHGIIPLARVHRAAGGELPDHHLPSEPANPPCPPQHGQRSASSTARPTHAPTKVVGVVTMSRAGASGSPTHRWPSGTDPLSGRRERSSPPRSPGRPSPSPRRTGRPEARSRHRCEPR